MHDRFYAGAGRHQFDADIPFNNRHATAIEVIGCLYFIVVAADKDADRKRPDWSCKIGKCSALRCITQVGYKIDLSSLHCIEKPRPSLERSVMDIEFQALGDLLSEFDCKARWSPVAFHRRVVRREVL